MKKFGIISIFAIIAIVMIFFFNLTRSAFHIPSNTEHIENIQEISFEKTDNEFIYIEQSDIENDINTYQTNEVFSDLDDLGRVGKAYSFVTKDKMPTDKRESIGMIKPSGWHTYKFPEVIEDNYLYNRCHLIGWQLTGQNANEKNLITGTRQLNLAMLPFENEIADFVKKGNSVAMSVTPIYTKDNLLCDGIWFQAKSTDSKLNITNDININVYIFNKQKGVDINYTTGEAKLSS